jgi:hypothetical protein
MAVQCGNIPEHEKRANGTPMETDHAQDNGFDRVEMIAEARDPTADSFLTIEHARILQRGSIHRSGEEFRKLGFNLKICPKSDDIAGLQIADITVSVVRRKIAHGLTRDYFPILYGTVSKKFRRSPSGNAAGYGLIIYPQKKDSL